MKDQNRIKVKTGIKGGRIAVNHNRRAL